MPDKSQRDADDQKEMARVAADAYDMEVFLGDYQLTEMPAGPAKEAFEKKVDSGRDLRDSLRKAQKC